MFDRVLNKHFHYVVMLLFVLILFSILQPQQTFPRSKTTIETLKKGAKYVQR